MFVNFGSNNPEVEFVRTEFNKICGEHPECTGCPLLLQEIQMGRSSVTCLTGRSKNMTDKAN